MPEASANVGSALKRIRQTMNLSLDKAAAMTGVSKAMLGQIERGESSPTVSTLWKISAGLRVTFSSLLGEELQQYAVTRLEDIEPVYEDGGRMVLHNLYPFDPITGFDYLYIRLEPGCDYHSPSHANVQEEFVVVTAGRLTMEIDGERFHLEVGSSIRFRGSAAHAYLNETNSSVVFQCVLKYL